MSSVAIVIDWKRLEGHFTLDKTPGVTFATSLVDMHRDICGITHSSLSVLLDAYKEAVDKSMCIRYKTKTLKGLVKDAIATKQIDIEAVEVSNEKLASQLKELRAS